MKRLLYSICLLVILCPVKLQAQEGQPLDMLIASTADALVDWLFSLPRYNDVESGRLYDTAVYFLKDYRFSNSIVKYMTHKPNMVYTQKNGSAWIYSYQEYSEQKWHLTKKVRLPKEMTLNILDGPFIKFYHDTISIHIRSVPSVHPISLSILPAWSHTRALGRAGCDRSCRSSLYLFSPL